MKKVVSLFLFLFVHSIVSAGNLSFTFGDIAHIIDVSPPFVARAGGTVVMSFEVTREKVFRSAAISRILSTRMVWSSRNRLFGGAQSGRFLRLCKL